MERHTGADRLLPLAGVVFTALNVLAAIAFPMPPGGDVAPGRRPAWSAAHAGAIVAQGYVRAAAALAFVLLAVAVAAVIRREGASRAAGTAALVCGAATGTLLLLAQAAAIGSGLAADDRAGAAVVRGLGYADDAFLTLSSLPAVVLFAAAGLWFLRARLVPAWLAWATLAGVPFALLDALSYDGGPFEAVGIIGLAYFLLWSLAIGISLFAGQRPPRAAALGTA
jgi:hypothetical protein